MKLEGPIRQRVGFGRMAMLIVQGRRVRVKRELVPDIKVLQQDVYVQLVGDESERDTHGTTTLEATSATTVPYDVMVTRGMGS